MARCRSEGQSEPNLPRSLLRALKVSRESDRLKQCRIELSGVSTGGQRHAPVVERSGRATSNDLARIQGVEHVEHFANQLDARPAGKAEDFRHAEVQLRLWPRSPAADECAIANFFDLADTGVGVVLLPAAYALDGRSIT